MGYRVINMKEFTFEGSDIHVTVPGDMFILNTDFSVRFVMVTAGKMARRLRILPYDADL